MIITCAITGAETTLEQNPALPITPKEIAQAALIEIAIEVEGTEVHDPGGLLEGNVNVSDIITGSYKYDSETTASFPYQPNEEIYQHNNPPYDIFFGADSESFTSNRTPTTVPTPVRHGQTPIPI